MARAGVQSGETEVVVVDYASLRCPQCRTPLQVLRNVEVELPAERYSWEHESRRFRTRSTVLVCPSCEHAE
jgi:uncharacterized protein YbaR (Trm112 family)